MRGSFRKPNRGAASLTVYCKCGKAISIAAEHRGKRIKCKECGRELRVGIATQLPLRFGAALTVSALGYLAAISVIAVVMWRFGDAWWPATFVLFMGRWVFLLPLLVLAPAAFVFRRPLLVPVLLAAVICVGPVMGFRTGWHRMFAHAAGTRVRVLTFNVDGGDSVLPMLPTLLEEWHPDFVALQECGDNLAGLVTSLPGWYHHRVRQLCFLSRHPLLDSAVMDRRGLEQVKESGAGIGGTGDVARYTVQMPQGTVQVTNLHLETPRKGLEGALSGRFSAAKLQDNTELRTIESNLARRWVNAGTGPAIVMGDFNTPIESRIFQGAWGDMTDAFSRAGFGFGMTRLNGWIRARIDHVLTGKQWYTDRVQLGPDVGSDHLPLIVDLTLVPGG